MCQTELSLVAWIGLLLLIHPRQILKYSKYMISPLQYLLRNSCVLFHDLKSLLLHFLFSLFGVSYVSVVFCVVFQHLLYLLAFSLVAVASQGHSTNIPVHCSLFTCCQIFIIYMSVVSRDFKLYVSTCCFPSMCAQNVVSLLLQLSVRV